MDVRKAKSFLLRSLDTTNAVTTTVGDNLNINPTIWERQLREFQRENLVVTPFALYQDFTQPGSELTVTIDENPGASAELTETVDVPISSISTRQVTHNPTEHGKAYQVTKKEARRGFFNLIENVVMKLSFATALEKEENAIETLYDGAGKTFYAGGKADRSSLTSSDVMTLKDILVSRAYMKRKLYSPNVLFVTPEVEGQILDLPGVQRANEFGDTSAIRQGFLGNLFGVNIVMSDNLEVVENGTVSRNILLGTTRNGEPAFGHGVKSLVAIERQYWARGRYWDVVADEDYDFLMYHPDACVVMECHNGDFTFEESS